MSDANAACRQLAGERFTLSVDAQGCVDEIRPCAKTVEGREDTIGAIGDEIAARDRRHPSGTRRRVSPSAAAASELRAWSHEVRIFP